MDSFIEGLATFVLGALIVVVLIYGMGRIYDNVTAPPVKHNELKVLNSFYEPKFAGTVEEVEIHGNKYLILAGSKPCMIPETPVTAEAK